MSSNLQIENIFAAGIGSGDTVSQSRGHAQKASYIRIRKMAALLAGARYEPSGY